ncbi:DUF47 family protein [Candidatus Hecatella orcuttiae]|uniref:DUF47 family protein n=1 Tax=Candidatus Hecatella orcuttiae TaxID=1935119 RepID=UPI0028680A2E|nr:DUF47 family protein [Candidatus Hecatella orcuttiae]
MALPREAAEQLRRRILETCQEHIRKALDSLREVCLMIAAYQSGDENQVFQHHINVVSNNEKSSQIRDTIMNEVADVGAVLLSREDFIRLTSEVEAISDICMGISYRISEMTKRKWKADLEVMKEVGSLAEASLNCLVRLRETILALSYGTSKVLEAARNVEAAEKTVDNIHRKVDLKIISSGMKVNMIFLVREIAEFLEEVADVSENIAQTSKILALIT